MDLAVKHEDHISCSDPGQAIDTCDLTFEASHRISPDISLHTFSCAAGTGHGAELAWSLRPTQHVTLQFPPSLDPIGGSRSLTDDDRRLTLTPCRLRRDAVRASGTIALQSMDFLVRSGRVTGLLGIPRPGHDLTAQVISIGGGFPAEVFEDPVTITCIAGGTGVSCFLALAGSGTEQSVEGYSTNSPGRRRQGSRSLVWSIRADDFEVVEFSLDSGLLEVDDWTSIRIFVTAGEAGQITRDMLAGKPIIWWLDRFLQLEQRFGVSLSLKCGRMTKNHLDAVVARGRNTILFCGSKSLEWQVRMWALDSPVKVYRTDR